MSQNLLAGRPVSELTTSPSGVLLRLLKVQLLHPPSAQAWVAVGRMGMAVVFHTSRNVHIRAPANSS